MFAWQKSSWFPPAVVFVALMALICFSSFIARQNNIKSIQEQVQGYSTEVEGELRLKVDIIKERLSAVSGLFLVSDSVNRQQWSDFINNAGLNSEASGVVTFGFAPVVSASEIVEFERSASTEQRQYSIFPKTDERISIPVLYIEPMTEDNIDALGFDLYSETNRREAIDESNSKRLPILSPAVRLINADASEETGFLIVSPVVRGSNSQVNGYVYAVLNSAEFFDEALKSKDSDIFSYSVSSGFMKVYEQDKFDELEDNGSGRYQSTAIIDGVGMQFTYAYSPNRVLPRTINNRPLAILIVGSIIALLISFVLWLIIRDKETTLQLENERDINQAKDSLISLASHQLRTPATGVKQYLGLLLQGFVGDLTDRQTELLKKANDSNERQLINDILYLARLESGRITASIAVVDIREVILNLVDELTGQFKASGNMLKIKMENRPILVKADEHMLRMCIENLLTNANKYSPDSSTINLVVDTSNGMVRVEVRDKGIGISREDEHLLFKQFSRIPNDMTKSVSGTGVGLYLVKKLIQLQNGKVHYEPNPKGGSVFVLHIPRPVKNSTKNKKKNGKVK